MISWIQTTFQHHFKVIFAVLLGLIIIAFVFTIGASPGIGRAERATVARQYFDLNLNKAEDQQKLFGDAQLSAFLNLGYGGVEGAQLQMYALQRYAALKLADELHVPEPSEAEYLSFVKSLRPFLNQAGEFDPVAYNRFKDSIKKSGNVSEGSVARVLKADYRVEKLNRLVAGPGYVLNRDISQQLARADTKWTLTLATLDYDSFKPSISTPDAEVSKFFEDNAFRYEIAPMFSGYVVEFSLMPYLAKVKISDTELRSFYEANKSRFPAPAQTQGAPKLDDANAFAAVKTQVEEALKIEKARKEAVNAAANITISLFENKATAANIAKLLQDKGLALKEIPPFTQDAPPAQFGNPEEFSHQAFKLGRDRLFSDALASNQGAVFLVWKETIPSRKPALAEVLTKVKADFTENERRKLFITAGRGLKSIVEAKLKAGESFSKAITAAAAAAGIKVETKDVPAFTFRQPPQDIDYAVVGALEHLEKGQVSEMTGSANKGLVVFAADKSIPDLSENNPQYQMAKAQIAKISGNATGASVLSELVDRELGRSAPAEAKK